jgi:hypothetical protein
LTFSKQETGGLTRTSLAATLPGSEYLNQDFHPPPTTGGEETKTVDRINAEAMRAVRKNREESEK